MDEDEGQDNKERNQRVLDMREGGSSWLEIQAEFDLSRQQARHAYQLGKRVVRRKAGRQVE